MSHLAHFAAVILTIGLVARPAAAQMYTPQSPEVKELVQGGLKFLEGNIGYVTDEAEKALVGYAVLKAQLCYEGKTTPEHPIVQEALRAVLEKGTDDRYSYTYAMCVKLMFLSALDPVAYRPQIDAILAELIARQKAHGGWGYETHQTGDTSMSQLAILTLWELEHHGILTPDNAWEKSVNWFLRTQDPSGGFGYQGIEGAIGAPVAQRDVRESLTAGGAGSLYIIFDHINGGSVIKAPEIDEGLPPEVRRKLEEEEAGRVKRSKVIVNVDRGALESAMSKADGWLSTTAVFPPKEHSYYFLYALERYHAFKDKSEGNPDNPGGAWYDSGVTYLRAKAGAKNNGWRGERNAAVDTSFCILFLIRSSQLSIQAHPSLGDGLLTGARGLKGDLTQVGLDRTGVLRVKKMSGPASEIIEALNDPEKREAALEAVAELVQEADDATLNEHAAKLRKLVTGNDPAGRQLALWTMARQRNLDDVPTLIYCLDDPHEDVRQTAHGALRFISRRLTSAPPSLPTEKEEHALAVRDWKDWFLAIRPNAVFDE